MKTPQIEQLTLEKIVGGGQTLGHQANGRAVFVWGALPGETASVRITKKKSRLAEGVAESILLPSKERVAPRDETTYLSTSPWQILSFDAEQHYKSALIEEAFELHNIVLPQPITVFTDGREYHYRNKVEFSFFGQQEDDGTDKLDLAFFRRGSMGKVIVEQCSLLPDTMMQTARDITRYLESSHISARQLKTLLIRCDQSGQCVWQLYVKVDDFSLTADDIARHVSALGGEIIYSDPKSPASRITKRLSQAGDLVLTDTILGVPFRYATEGFFQVNLPVYEGALTDMADWVEERDTVDMYAGVGSIGLTIGKGKVTLVEVNEDAVREMRRNIQELGREETAEAVLAPSEKSLGYITSDATIILDPPRAGLHQDVIDALLSAAPERIVYLSCNPVTQARDVALLAARYGVRHHQGYNFFPRTPHIEHLVVLDRISS
jgi:23S rRNA (uracil1939-C5)-methyltransferase